MVGSTHEITIGTNTVVKRYLSWDQGEPIREWVGLNLLDRYAPGLAPRPLERRTENGAPAIVMTRLPGQPLGASPLDRVQLDALCRALSQMYSAVPMEVLERVDKRRWGPEDLDARLRCWIQERHQPVSEPVESALRAAASWLNDPEAATLMKPHGDPVFTLADGNLGNFLWDGERCYVVDFEDSGLSDPAYEVADLVEHVSVWLPGLIAADELISRLGFSTQQLRRVLGYRRLMATFWLLMLLPGNSGHGRNPEGSVERQAHRMHALLEASP